MNNELGAHTVCAPATGVNEVSSAPSGVCWFVCRGKLMCFSLSSCMMSIRHEGEVRDASKQKADLCFFFPNGLFACRYFKLGVTLFQSIQLCLISMVFSWYLIMLLTKHPRAADALMKAIPCGNLPALSSVCSVCLNWCAHGQWEEHK